MSRPKSTIPTLTRTILKRRLAKKHRFRQEDVDVILTDAIKEFQMALLRGHRVELRGFGALHPIIRQSKPVRDITRGTGYVMPASIAVKFIPSIPLERGLRQRSAELRAEGAI